MLLRNKDSEETYHVPSGVGKALISAGLAEEVLPFIPTKVKQPMVWSIREGARVDDYQYPPVLFHSCPECGIRGMTESTQGTAHKTVKVYHCGLRGVMCPDDVAAQYQHAYAAWKSRSRKLPVEKISAVSPMRHIRAFGLKTKDELIVAATTIARNNTGQ